MKRLKRLFLLSMFVAVCNFAWAENVIFYCVQNTEAYEKAGEITTRLEDFVFDALFDSGLIAGNIPFTVNDDTVSDSIAEAQKLLENPSDYLIIIRLTYSDKPSVDKKTYEKFAVIEKLEYALFNVKTEKVVFHKNTNVSHADTKSASLKKLEKLSSAVIKQVTTKIVQGA